MFDFYDPGLSYIAVFFVSILVVVVGTIIIHRRRKKEDKSSAGFLKKKEKPSSSLPLLPRADAGFLESVRELVGDRSPFWMLEQALKTGSYSYRLPIPVRMAVIGDASLSRSILLDPVNDKALSLLKSFEIVLGGTCMFTQPNHLAKTTRKHTSRAFSPDLVKNRMAKVCDRRISEWIEAVLKPTISKEGATIDPCLEMLDVSFKIACEVIFDYDASREECELFMQHSVITTTEFNFKQMMNPLRPFLGKFLAERSKAYESVRWIQDFARKMLSEHQCKKKEHQSSSCKAITVISLIDDDPRYPSNEEKLPELILWLFSGHETVGYSMGTVLYHLAQNPSEMAKVRRALWTRNNKHNDDDNNNGGNPCKEVQNVIRESNRLLPATNLSIRKLGRDTVTSDGKFKIPKDTTVFLPQYLPNHDHRLYDDPSVFRPDRWNTATKEMIEANIPFAVGPRACPGLALAKMEMNRILPALIKDYDFELVQDGEPKHFMTLKPVGVLLRPKYAE